MQLSGQQVEVIGLSYGCVVPDDGDCIDWLDCVSIVSRPDRVPFSGMVGTCCTVSCWLSGEEEDVRLLVEACREGTRLWWLALVGGETPAREGNRVGTDARPPGVISV